MAWGALCSGEQTPEMQHRQRAQQPKAPEVHPPAGLRARSGCTERSACTPGLAAPAEDVSFAQPEQICVPAATLWFLEPGPQEELPPEVLPWGSGNSNRERNPGWSRTSGAATASPVWLGAGRAHSQTLLFCISPQSPAAGGNPASNSLYLRTPGRKPCNSQYSPSRPSFQCGWGAAASWLGCWCSAGW